MRTIKVSKKLIQTTKVFEFSTPYTIKADGNLFKKDNLAKVTAKLTIDYSKKEYHFDESDYRLKTNDGLHGLVDFKKGDDLDKTFKELFKVVKKFAKKEISKIKSKPTRQYSEIIKTF